MRSSAAASTSDARGVRHTWSGGLEPGARGGAAIARSTTPASRPLSAAPALAARSRFTSPSPLPVARARPPLNDALAATLPRPASAQVRAPAHGQRAPRPSLSAPVRLTHAARAGCVCAWAALGVSCWPGRGARNCSSLCPAAAKQRRRAPNARFGPPARVDALARARGGHGPRGALFAAAQCRRRAAHSLAGVATAPSPSGAAAHSLARAPVGRRRRARAHERPAARVRVWAAPLCQWLPLPRPCAAVAASLSIGPGVAAAAGFGARRWLRPRRAGGCVWRRGPRKRGGAGAPGGAPPIARRHRSALASRWPPQRAPLGRAGACCGGVCPPQAPAGCDGRGG